MLQAIFYARFHISRGPSVIHQYPTGSVVAPWDSGRTTLFDFSDIISYVIPAYDLCDRPLSLCIPADGKTKSGYRILGYPVSLEGPEYDRNRFTFNVCFIIDEDDDVAPWDSIVQKTASFFKNLETDDGLLQTEETLPGLKWADDSQYPVQGVGIIHDLLERVTKDLGTYRETCIAVDGLHVLNLRLDNQADKETQHIHGWNVPMLIRSLPSKDEWTWDLTLERIVPYIDGIRHLRRIAEEADVEPKLVRKVVEELMRNQRAIVLDLFHFQACYALTSDFDWFVQDNEMIQECKKFVSKSASTNGNPATNGGGGTASGEATSPSTETLIELYGALRIGLHISDFCREHNARLVGIDIRRFIVFGQIKGFIRRIHRYALAASKHTAADHQTKLASSLPKSSEEAAKELDRAWRKAALTSGWATPPSSLLNSGPFASGLTLSNSQKSQEEVRKEQDAKMRKYLDGTHCLDQICVEMKMTEKQVVERLRSGSLGEVFLFWR